MMVVLIPMTFIPLFFEIIALVEGEITAAAIPIGVSLLALTLFAFFAGKRRVLFDRATGEVSVRFRSLLRQQNESRDLGKLTGVLLYQEHSEGASMVVDPNSRPSLNGVRYRASLSFQNGAELSLNGNATMGSEAHHIAQIVLEWLRSSSNASGTD